ncbi:hypothetical protein ACAN107058_14645 [Paracidovorax anthurii]
MARAVVGLVAPRRAARRPPGHRVAQGVVARLAADLGGLRVCAGAGGVPAVVQQRRGALALVHRHGREDRLGLPAQCVVFVARGALLRPARRFRARGEVAQRVVGHARDDPRRAVGQVHLGRGFLHEPARRVVVVGPGAAGLVGEGGLAARAVVGGALGLLRRVGAGDQVARRVVLQALGAVGRRARGLGHEGEVDLGAADAVEVLVRAVRVELVERLVVLARGHVDVAHDAFFDPAQHVLRVGAQTLVGGVEVVRARARRAQAVQRGRAGRGGAAQVADVALGLPAVLQGLVALGRVARVEVVAGAARAAQAVEGPEPVSARGLHVAGDAFVDPVVGALRAHVGGALGEAARPVVHVALQLPERVAREAQPARGVVVVARGAVGAACRRILGDGAAAELARLRALALQCGDLGVGERRGALAHPQQQPGAVVEALGGTALGIDRQRLAPRAVQEVPHRAVLAAGHRRGFGQQHRPGLRAAVGIGRYRQARLAHQAAGRVVAVGGDGPARIHLRGEPPGRVVDLAHEGIREAGLRHVDRPILRAGVAAGGGIARALQQAAVLVVEVLGDAARAVGAQDEAPGRVVAHARVLVALRVVERPHAIADFGLVRPCGQRLHGQVQRLRIADALGDVAVGVVALGSHRARAVDGVARAAQCVVDGARDGVRGTRGRLRDVARAPLREVDAVGIRGALHHAAAAVVDEAHHVARAVDGGRHAVVRVVDAVLGEVPRGVRALEAVQLPFAHLQRQAVHTRQRLGVAGLAHHAAGRVVDGLRQVARRVEHEALAALWVVGVARDVALRVRDARDVARGIVGIAPGEVETRVRGRGRVHDLQHPAAQGVVLVGGGRAVGVGDGDLAAHAVVGIGGDEVQARGVHRLAHELALGVVAELRDHALRVRHAQLVAQRVVGVGGDQVQAARVHRAREHPARRIVGERGLHAIGVRRLHEAARRVVAARRAGEGRLHRRLAAIGVVFVAGDRAVAVPDRDGLAEPVVHGGDGDAFGRGDGDAALLQAVGVGGHVPQRIGLGDGAAEGVVGRRGAAAQRIGGGDEPAQAVVGLRAHLPERIGGGDGATEGVVGDGAGKAQRVRVLHALHGQAPAVVGGVHRLHGARAQRGRAAHLLAEGVVDVVLREALGIGGLRERARGVVAVAGGAVRRGAAGLPENGQHAGAGKAAGLASRAGQRRAVDAARVARAGLRLAERVVARLGDLAQRVDGVGQAPDRVVEEERLLAVLVGGGGAAARRVVAVAQAVLLPDRIDLGGALAAVQQRRALRGEFAHQAALVVVAGGRAARLGVAGGLRGLHQPAHAVVAVARGRAFRVHRYGHAVERIVGAGGDLVLRRGGGQEVGQAGGRGDLRRRDRGHGIGVAPHGHGVAVAVVAALREVPLGVEFADPAALGVVEIGRVRIPRAGRGTQAGDRSRGTGSGRAAGNRLHIPRAADEPARRVVAVFGEVAFAIHRAGQQSILAVDLHGGAVLRAPRQRRQRLSVHRMPRQHRRGTSRVGGVAEVHGAEAVQCRRRHIDVQHGQAVGEVRGAQRRVAVVEGHPPGRLAARHLGAEQGPQALGRAGGHGAEGHGGGVLPWRDRQLEVEQCRRRGRVTAIADRELVVAHRQPACGQQSHPVHDAGRGHDGVAIDERDGAAGTSVHGDGDVTALLQAGAGRQRERGGSRGGDGLRQHAGAARPVARIALVAGAQFVGARRQPRDDEAGHAIDHLGRAQDGAGTQEGDGAPGLPARDARAQRHGGVTAHARGRGVQGDGGGGGQDDRGDRLGGAGFEPLESVVYRGQRARASRQVIEREPRHAVDGLHGPDQRIARVEAHRASDALRAPGRRDGGV